MIPSCNKVTPNLKSTCSTVAVLFLISLLIFLIIFLFSQMLPKIEKPDKQDSKARLEAHMEEADKKVDIHVKQEVSPSTKTPQTPTEMPLTPEEMPQSPTPMPQTPKASEPQERKPPLLPCATPKGKPECLVEEELIISPDSYTPLLMTRQKRRRVTDSPVVDLEKALAASVLVEESPESTPATVALSSGDSPLSVAERNGEKDSEASNEIASFLAEDDLVEIQESFIEEDAETPSSINQDSGDIGDNFTSDVAEPSSASEDASPVKMMKNKRRSVCRRVAVIESSEDEVEDEENKENLHPSFSNTSYCSKQDKEMEDKEMEDQEEEESTDREQEEEEYDVDGAVEVDQTDSADEMDGANEVGDDEVGLEEATEGADGSVVVYDESMTEEREGERFWCRHSTPLRCLIFMELFFSQVYHNTFFVNNFVSMGFLPWEIQVAFPRESQLRQSHYPTYGACWVF